MRAIQFNATIPRYAFGKIFGKIYRPILWSGLSCLLYRDVPEPRLPNDAWVKIKTRYGGICGSDLHTINLHPSPSVSAITSFPFTQGHENCGTIAELGSAVRGFAIGDRVVVDPGLSCAPRGFDKPCRYCARGEMQLCERVTEGAIAPGLEIGACRDTGGSWSPYFVAHRSQLFRVPANVSDENALMVEPFATALHAVLANPPREDETILVLGAGVIGLCIIAALRAIDCKSRIIAITRHQVQRDLAKRFSADQVIDASRGADYYTEFTRAINGKLLKPIIGKRVLVGGADVVYECVGNADTLDDALRFTGAGGKVVLVGLASVPRGVDWTPIWMNELQIKGTYTYGHDHFQGKRWQTFDLALDLMARGKVDLASLITHKFALEDYARALQTAHHRGRARAVKVVFEFK